MVERFFRDTTTRRLRRWVFRSVPELVATIKQYIAVHNRNSEPLIWTALRLTTSWRRSFVPIGP